MAHRLALIAHRRAEIVAAAADPARKELLIDHPVGKSFFVTGDDLGTLAAKRRIEILIAEGNRVFFNVAVGVDDFQMSNPPSSWSQLAYNKRFIRDSTGEATGLTMFRGPNVQAVLLKNPRFARDPG